MGLAEGQCMRLRANEDELQPQQLGVLQELGCSRGNMHHPELVEPFASRRPIPVPPAGGSGGGNWWHRRSGGPSYRLSGPAHWRQPVKVSLPTVLRIPTMTTAASDAPDALYTHVRSTRQSALSPLHFAGLIMHARRTFESSDAASATSSVFASARVDYHAAASASCLSRLVRHQFVDEDLKR